MGEVKAIETRYAGCRFRSRLEARWAVFFDALGVKWEYEREGFDLFPDSGWDQYHVWCRCPVCGMVGIEFSGEWDRLDCQHGDGYKGYCPEECDPIILKAYDAARSARFEHGESG
jgi:hypothetical protein